MNRRGKFLATWTMAGALVTLIASGLAIKDRVLEEWFLWKLEKGCVEERVGAAGRLGEMRSARAVRPLLAGMERDCVREFGPTLSGEHFTSVADCETTESFLRAFGNIGHPAMLELMGALTDGKQETKVFASLALDRIYRNKQERIPSGGPRFLVEIEPLLQAIEDDVQLDQEVRQAAAETLRLLAWRMIRS
jgi:hypothetical protein